MHNSFYSDASGVFSVPRSSLPVNELAKARRLDRYKTRWPKGGQDVASDVEHVVIGNERFNSFAAFEKSRAADLLDSSVSDGIEAPEAMKLQRVLRNFSSRLTDGGADTTAIEVYDRLVAALPQKIAEAKARGERYIMAGVDVQKALAEAKNSTRRYAELKNYGQTPLNGDTWAGAIYKPADDFTSYADIAALDNVLAQLKHRKIPVLKTSTSPEQDFRLATMLQKNAR